MLLDNLLQLHEEIRITYAVTHYEASLGTGDGGRISAKAEGKNPLEALVELEKFCCLTGLTLEVIRRASPPKKSAISEIRRLRAASLEKVERLRQGMGSAGERRDWDTLQNFEAELSHELTRLNLLNQLADCDE